ncbi:hypothetical protein R1sor_019615 [Riccia sorocarpa]|uniref:Uncharacterized protein n=1 Tax=Riccia sorocarpa TaxID=122646 RepID=A0ABD3ID06_9MARC
MKDKEDGRVGTDGTSTGVCSEGLTVSFAPSSAVLTTLEMSSLYFTGVIGDRFLLRVETPKDFQAESDGQRSYQYHVLLGDIPPPVLSQSKKDQGGSQSSETGTNNDREDKVANSRTADIPSASPATHDEEDKPNHSRGVKRIASCRSSKEEEDPKHNRAKTTEN